MSENELRPCPFCGVTKWSDWRHYGSVTQICGRCGCQIDRDFINTRPIEDALQAHIADLEKENAALKNVPIPIEYWSDEKKEIYRRNESRSIKSGREA